ncbi:cytochrome P450 [Apiospora phragmitis]|uniref:Cytochrome P450 n=1 Tax=Apiospora phragmitis TaxID=2905665 RepID=A0ABR1VY61_9PEZI
MEGISNTVPHELHRARRQPLNHFFSKARVASQQNVIDRSLVIFCDRISKFAVAGKAVALGAAISALTRDIACEFLLDKTYAHLKREDFHVNVTNMLQSGGVVWRVTKHESQRDTRELIRVATMSSSSSYTPGTKDESPRTIVHKIVNSNLAPSEKKFERVMNDVATITGAGFETAASALRLIFYHLATVDAAKDKLKTLEQLPYLTSVIMEGMRLSPAIGSRAARIAPDRDLFYEGDDGYTMRIPAGTPVGMTTILMHTNETLYPAPLSFNPDRWMDAGARRRLEKTYAPFSRGTRICLGMHLAWAEMYLIVSEVIQHFDIKF